MKGSIRQRRKETDSEYTGETRVFVSAGGAFRKRISE